VPVKREYLAIGLALLLSFSLIGLPVPQKEGVARRFQSAFLAAGQRLFARAIHYARTAERTRFLLAQNVELALDNMWLREVAWENRRLRQALGFKETELAQQIIPAEVIARDPDQMYDTVVIDAGDAQGVREGWPVVTPNGLVGHVSQVSENSSVVQLIMRSRISALVQERRAQGVVSWIQGRRFRLEYVDATSDIKKGDRVVTSGLGERFPKGIAVGSITELRLQKREPMFKEIVVETAVDFWNLEEVFIIQGL